MEKKRDCANGDVGQETLTYTLGELFNNKDGIELVQDRRLALWADGQEIIGSTVNYAGKRYAATPLEPKWLRALRPPSCTADFGGTHHLLLAIASAIGKWVPLDEPTCQELAAWVMATWVIESLPAQPCLNVWGTAAPDTALLQVLACLARRPLSVPRLSLSEIAKVPAGVCATLLCRQPAQRSVQECLLAGSEPGLEVLVGGEPRSMRYALMISSPEPLPLPVLNVQVLPSGAGLPRLTTAHREALRERFVPQLARYRLSQHHAVALSEFDAPGFAHHTRTVARILGAALETDAEAQSGLLAALRAQDEANKVEQSQAPAAVVLEALLSLCHEAKPMTQVEEVAELANAIWFGRHELLELSARKVGDILRHQLGLTPHRSGAGYRLVLDQNTCARIHRLSASYHVLTLLQPATECTWCRQLPFSRDIRSTPSLVPATNLADNVHDVQHVQEIEDGQFVDVLGDVPPVESDAGTQAAGAEGDGRA